MSQIERAAGEEVWEQGREAMERKLAALPEGRRGAPNPSPVRAAGRRGGWRVERTFERRERRPWQQLQEATTLSAVRTRRKRRGREETVSLSR